MRVYARLLASLGGFSPSARPAHAVFGAASAASQGESDGPPFSGALAIPSNTRPGPASMSMDAPSIRQELGGVANRFGISADGRSDRALEADDSWGEMVAEIDGPFVPRVSVSGNGKILAVGYAPDGAVRVYEVDENGYTQRDVLDGSVLFDQGYFGDSLAMSNDGGILAVGCPSNGCNAVFVYEWDGNQYIQRDNKITGETTGDPNRYNFGYAVSMSSDGGILAIGGPGNTDNGYNSGHVRVYEWDTTDATQKKYTQRGIELDGEAADGRFGEKISMSNDGGILAIAAIRNGPGFVRVYEWDMIQKKYTQRGTDIDGEAPGDLSGSVSMSNDGNILAIGAFYNDGVNGTNSGHVRVHEWDENEKDYKQRGSDIDGEDEKDYSGQYISMSDDGGILAIGARYNDGSGTDRGHVRVYEWDGNKDDYSQQGDDIDGRPEGERFGNGVSISSDGGILAVGGGRTSGYIRVFARTTPSSTTSGPTSSPTTSGPTNAPTTTEPTGSPTTVAPTSTPWTIDFIGIVSDFSSSSGDEVVMTYEVGKNRTEETHLYKGDCASSITDLTVNTTEVRTNINGTHDLLTLRHSVDKSAIANSTTWDPVTNKFKFCQFVRLIIPEGTDQLKMEIATDYREVVIDFDLSADFAIENELGAGTIEEAAGETNVSSYVEACKCNGPDNFTCEPDALVPNTQLHVCIKSVSTDVQVKELKSMVVTQGDSVLNVILGGLVQLSSIAGMTYVKAQNGVVVSTFVPTNMFNYAAGASINITGGIDMELVGSGRLLARVLNGDALGADGDDQEFDLKVDLKEEVIVLEGEGGWMDSSGSVLDGASALLGVALLIAYGLW